MPFDFGKIQIHPKAVPGIQAKLAISEPNDAYEQEADRVAEQDLRKLEPPLQPDDAQSGAESTNQSAPQRFVIARMQTKSLAANPAPPIAAPPIVDQVLHTSGQPLDGHSRAYFESRFSYDFGQVRIHNGAQAAESARAVNARAYTVGSEVVFGAGQFAPATTAGRQLIAHELAHVVQQAGAGAPHSQRDAPRQDAPANDTIAFDQGTAMSGNDSIAISRSADSNTLRRAEVEDRDTICSPLTDVTAVVNQWVNQELAKARTAPGIANLGSFFEDVLAKTAGGANSPVTPIERYIEGLPPSQRFLPPNDLAGTRYASQSALSMYSAQGKPFYIVGPTIKLGELCVGADKLGHLFQQGKQYFDLKYQPIMAALQQNPASVQQESQQTALLNQGVAAAESFGRGTEIDRAGLATTGVFSNADLAANAAGMKFWDDLMSDPNLNFDVGSYATIQWNEYANPNFYEESTGKNVWATQLSGTWRGTLQVGGAKVPVDVVLTATNKGVASGTFTYQNALAPNPPVSGTITGTIGYNAMMVSGSIGDAALHGSKGTHSATPIKSVTINFEWTNGAGTGKGMWNSSGEHKLVGTYGNGSSPNNIGSFDVTRVP